MWILIINLIFCSSLIHAGHNDVVRIKGPESPLSDPLKEDTQEFHFSFLPVIEIFNKRKLGTTEIHGLSTLEYEYHFNALRRNLQFRLTMKHMNLSTTDFQIHGKLDARPFRSETFPFGEITGEGPARVEIENLNFKGEASLYVNFITRRMSVRSIRLHAFSFDSLRMEMGFNFSIGGNPVDWNSWNAGLKENFDADYSRFRIGIQDKLKVAVNTKIGNKPYDEIFGWTKKLRMGYTNSTDSSNK